MTSQGIPLELKRHKRCHVLDGLTRSVPGLLDYHFQTD